MQSSTMESARAAGLRYVSDDRPGIRRRRTGRSFTYVGTDGKTVRDPQELARIKRLAIPPAYEDVWISPAADGHIQATARDARGRKQYRYHQRWIEARDESKFHRMLAFGKALPKIRERVEADLAAPGLTREKVLATVVKLLESTLIRVGNEEYAKANRSYGLTTLRNRHVEVEGTTVHFAFRGKSGVEHAVDVRDRRVAKIVKTCQDLPGQELFAYLDREGVRHSIGSHDVNAYLQDLCGDDFTAKDFRTLAGTVFCATALEAFEKTGSKAEAKRNVLQAMKAVSQRLGNTPSVCRKAYVHPAVIEAYLARGSLAIVRKRVARELASHHALSADESAILRFIEKAAQRDPQTEVRELLERSVRKASRRVRKPAR